MSKKLRRLLSLVFALALLAGLSLPAAAEGTISAAEPKESVDGGASSGTISSAGGGASSEEAAGGSIRPASGEETPSPAPPIREIFVSAGGDDMADGSREAPLATLAAAADLANETEQSTVYVILLSDLVTNRVARFNGKTVFLMSEGGVYAVTRSEFFQTAYDDLRHVYNPAMIELGELLSAAPQTTSLTVENVALDDAGLHGGSEFLAQEVDPTLLQANPDRVQDAIIAVYNSSTLTLNAGTELRNFGGMSAVRGVGAATITFENYSSVLDTVYIPSPEGVKTIRAEGALVLIGSKAQVNERATVSAVQDAVGSDVGEDEVSGDEAAGNGGGDSDDTTLAEQLLALISGGGDTDDDTPDEPLPADEGGENEDGDLSDDTPSDDATSVDTLNDDTTNDDTLSDDTLNDDTTNDDTPDEPLPANEGGDNDDAPLAEQILALIGSGALSDDTLNDGEGGNTDAAAPAEQLLALLGSGGEDLSADALGELLAEVPSEQLQALLDALNAQDSEAAAALIARLAEDLGDDEPGGELIRRLNALLPADEDSDSGDAGIDGTDAAGNADSVSDAGSNGLLGDSAGAAGSTTVADLYDLLGGAFSLADLTDMLSGFSPEQLGSLANLISGSGTDADVSTLFGGMAGTAGLMELVGDPAQLINGEDPYLLDYTLTVNLPDTLVRTLTLAAASVSAGTGQFTVIPDSRLELVYLSGAPVTVFTSNIFQVDNISVTAGNNLVVSFSLKAGWRDYLNDLSSPIRFAWATELPTAAFEEDGELVTRAQLDSLELQVGSSTVPGDLGEVGAEVRTKMLSGDGAMLRYDLNGGEGGPHPNPLFVNAQTGYALETVNTPTHRDTNGKPVVFLGWTREKDSTIYSRSDREPFLQTSITVTAGEDQTVYAVYSYDENEDGIPDVQQALVLLSFDANGGAGAPDPIWAVAVAGVGASIDIPKTEPTLKYYTFLGWSKDKEATAAEYNHDAQKSADRDILITKDTTLYAVWQQNPTYTLYYNANGGTGAPASQSGISDENDTVEMIIASGVPTRSGYSFLGWSAHRSGSADYFAGDKVNITGGNVTLYAIWQKNGSSYSGGGGGGSGAPKTGDDAPIALYAALAVISLGAVGAGAWLILRKRK